MVLFSLYFVYLLTDANKKNIEKINYGIKEKRRLVEKAGVRSHSTKKETEVSQTEIIAAAVDNPDLALFSLCSTGKPSLETLHPDFLLVIQRIAPLGNSCNC